MIEIDRMNISNVKLALKTVESEMGVAENALVVFSRIQDEINDKNTVVNGLTKKEVDSIIADLNENIEYLTNKRKIIATLVACAVATDNNQ